MSWASLILLAGILVALVIISKQLKETKKVLSLLSDRINQWFDHKIDTEDEKQLHQFKSIDYELNTTRNCVEQILSKLEEQELNKK
jgi:hypothetical protein